ncbi:hypothetical protein EDB89DRAFT_2227114 [Lactarius sanguifluus]|nr:hypothetical protein EDB89DRAFT_2227114 [Lactarius sanguifluus]
MHTPKRARARYVSRPQAVTTPNEYPLTIGKLSDEVLLNIFRYYMDASPQLWPRLVRICRKWRQIVFASQQALRLRLFCTPGTPVLKTLDLWPALPIVVQYGGSLAHGPPAPEDEDNIMAALKQSARVSSIHLAVTRSLREAFNAIEAPFSELEDLVLLSQDGVRLTLPNTFRWGPHLHSLHLTRITFPGLSQLLCSSKNLVELQLHGVFKALQLSPDALADALSGMTQLRTLSLPLQISLAQPHHPEDALFSLLSLVSIFEECPSTLKALWSECMPLVSGTSKSHFSMNSSSTFQI